MIDPSTTPAIDAFISRMTMVMYFDFSRYLIAAGVMAALLIVFRGWARNRRIQTRSAKREDYLREFLSSLRTCFVFALISFLTLGGEELGIIELELQSFSAWTLVWQSALMIVAHDAYFYWMHRALHHRRLFRATHLHHHKSRTPTPWAAYSFSTWEAITESIFVPLFLIVTSLFGIAYAGLAILFFVWHMIIRNVMAHAGHELLPAGWLDIPVLRRITTTTHHDLHHSSGYNYGFYFTWWDRWMGTEHPRYAENFNRVAKPIVMPRIAAGSAGRVGVFIAAVLAGALTANGWLLAVDPTII